ncbi:glycosyltransferase family 1 protein [Phototrophicus methaneseepsis]|uniref:Glycosyltransferase family 1 protein n=1 Tax=Phototrophicus methaneseepsis TaxID=2710758 RepID=A0A7S8ICP3_9CHLR|nr:glycosyltransferase family 1 protein [Phototrophicus methaneseepsis]QPC81765.1 glycosyltransferase family 1 protein [Phototrophicus methaneseepsis]
MADHRVRQLFAARYTAQGADLYGEYDLVDPNYAKYPPAPVQRVAVLTEAFLPKVDGVSKTTYLTIRYLQETGREVLVFAPDTSIPRVGDSEVIALPSLSVPRAPETRMALPSPMVVKRIEEFQPDLIHLCSPAFMTVNGMAAGRYLNIPVVANYQTDLPGYAKRYGAPMLATPVRLWLRYLHNGCHINLVPTEMVRNDLQSYGFRRLRVWGRGVNTERFHPSFKSAAMRERLLNGRDPDSLLIIYVGRLAYEKCVDQLIEVAKVPGVALTIIGDGATREELETLFAGTNTHFTGYMVGDELSQAFASADAFFFPGPNETFGQVVQEAMASAITCVVTSEGAVSALVNHGETGLICEHEPEAFAEAARQLAENRDWAIEMGQKGYELVRERPWAAIMNQLERHYAEAQMLSQRYLHHFGTSHYANAITLTGYFPRVRPFSDGQSNAETDSNSTQRTAS